MEYIFEVIAKDGKVGDTFTRWEELVNIVQLKDGCSIRVSNSLDNSLICELKNVDDISEFYGARARAAQWKGKLAKIDDNAKTAAAIGKPTISAIPPIAIIALGAAMKDGENKYGRFNWRATGSTASVFYDALGRHLLDWYSGEDFASDSKISHLAHIMAGCAILIDSIATGTFKDDRQKISPSSVSRENMQAWKRTDA